jgi:hypothetical protein
MTQDRAAGIIAGYEADMPLIGGQTTKSLEWLAFAINEALKAEALAAARKEGRRKGIEEVADWYWRTFQPNAPRIKADAFEITKMIRALADKEPT